MRPQNKHLRPVKKGEIRNPTGKQGPKVSQLVRKLTAREVEEVASLLINGDLESLKKIPSDKESSVLKILLASCIVKTINKGDPSALETILKRVIGPIKEKIEVTGTDGGPQVVITQTVVELPPKE